eukprot:357281-Chlamydomonas_euryale.AAC.7
MPHLALHNEGLKVASQRACLLQADGALNRWQCLLLRAFMRVVLCGWSCIQLIHSGVHGRSLQHTSRACMRNSTYPRGQRWGGPEHEPAHDAPAVVLQRVQSYLHYKIQDAGELVTRDTNSDDVVVVAAAAIAAAAHLLRSTAIVGVHAAPRQGAV